MANAAYIRVSTQDQSTDRQFADGTSWQGHSVNVAKTFEDKASGASTARPGLASLRAWVREGDTVYVWSLDRLARSLTDLLALVEEFRAKGVTVRFLKEVLEFGPDADVSAIARFQFQMLGAVAEFERSLIRERQLEGIKAAKAKGKKWGGSTPKLDDVSARQMLEELQSRSITKTQAATKYRLSRQTVYTYIRRNSETI